MLLYVSDLKICLQNENTPEVPAAATFLLTLHILEHIFRRALQSQCFALHVDLIFCCFRCAWLCVSVGDQKADYNEKRKLMKYLHTAYNELK